MPDACLQVPRTVGHERRRIARSPHSRAKVAGRLWPSFRQLLAASRRRHERRGMKYAQGEHARSC
eukprot:10253035-Alexandrium_andersonii.AAC.1